METNLEVRFKTEISESGEELIRVTLRKDDCEIRLTKEQAKSLARQIESRLEDE